MSDLAEGFSRIGTNNFICDCCGAVDGHLMRAITPRKKEVGNVRSCCSGHHKCCGANVQAIADCHSQFLFVAFAGPGVMGDRDALKQVTANDFTKQLPKGHCNVGDPACDPSEHVVPVHDGADRLIDKCDHFNFFASQLRIRVEMALGVMQNKWSISQKPVACCLKNVCVMIQVIGRLHNCCVNERLELDGGVNPELNIIPAANGQGANVAHFKLPTEPVDCDGNPLILDTGVAEQRRHLCFKSMWLIVSPRRALPGRSRKKSKCEANMTSNKFVANCID